jgi:prepilin-type N-terminal cleavage/methylation domain-containing protein
MSGLVGLCGRRRRARVGTVPYRRGIRRGFTLLEVAIASALTGVLLILVLQWVGQLARTGALGGIQHQAERDVQWVATRFQRDVDASVPCDVARRETSLASVSATAISFYVDEDADGTADLVRWELEGTKLLRSVAVATSPCSFAAFDEAVVVTDLVRSGTTTLVDVMTGGVLAPATATVSCLGEQAACPWRAAALRAVLARPDGTPLARLDVSASWGDETPG